VRGFTPGVRRQYREAAVLMKDWVERFAKLRTIDAGSYGAAGCHRNLPKITIWLLIT
jgi:hypothetical protein